jgi:hypothetical protein
MIGGAFHVLESCILLFPLHHPVLHTFSATLPNCSHLRFQGYPLDLLHGVSAKDLTHLSVMTSYRPQGSRQLVWLASRVLQESRLAPRILHISIEAKTQAWTKALAFMSNME